MKPACTREATQSASWRCQATRTRAGEDAAFASSFETHSWLHAGCAIAISTTACSRAPSTRFLWFGLRRLIERLFAAVRRQALGIEKTVAPVAHDPPRVREVAELLREFQPPDFGLTTFCSVATSGRAPFADPTYYMTVRLSVSDPSGFSVAFVASELMASVAFRGL